MCTNKQIMDYLSNLPNEIIIKIFQYCKIVPLSQTSSKFNDLIGNSSVLMKKINLVITEKSKSSEIVKSKRKFGKVLIKFNYKINESILEIFDHFSNGIRSLELLRCILTEDLFVKILKSLPNLSTLTTHITYFKSNIDGCDTDKRIILKLNSLKELNYRNSDHKILPMLASDSIRKINITSSVQHSVSITKKYLEQFHKLEVIENFMLSKIENIILTHIVCDLKYLRKLCLEIESINIEAVRNLQIENASIEILNLIGSPAIAMDFNVILSFFKKVRRLEIEINNSLDATNMQHLNNSIESLVIKNCSGDFFNHISLPNLRYFELSDVSIAILQAEWINFSQRNPKANVLKIKDESISNEIFINIAQQFRNLQHLELFYDPQRLTNEILDFISDSTLFPRNIKILKLSQRHRNGVDTFFVLTEEHKSSLQNNLGFQLILQ